MYTKDLPYHRLSVLNIFFHIYIHMYIFLCFSYLYMIYTLHFSLPYISILYIIYASSLPMPHHLLGMIYTHDPYTWTILSSIYTLHYLYFALSIYRLSLHNTCIHFLGNIYTLPVSYLYIICTLYIYIYLLYIQCKCIQDADTIYTL